MQIKNEAESGEETSSQKSAAGEQDVPIYSSIESLLIIPPSMSRELSAKALQTQELLDKWSNNRRKMVRKLEGIAEKLDNWEKGCAISTTVGSSVGITSGVAVIGGLMFLPPVAVTGLIVGTVAGLSNVATSVSKMYVWNQMAKEVRALIAEDERLFEHLMRSREELMEAIRKIVSDEEFMKSFEKDEDFEEKLKGIFGAAFAGTTGFGAKFMFSQMGRLSSSFVKGVLHSVAVIGILLDSATLALSVNTLRKGTGSEFGEEVVNLSFKMEMIRQKVVKHFLNQDVWDADDDQLSDVGSVEMVSSSPFQSMNRSIADQHD